MLKRNRFKRCKGRKLALWLCVIFTSAANGQGYEATRNTDPYALAPDGQFGYWNGVQLLVPFGLPPEREEIALSLWLQLMDVCPECRTAFSPGAPGVGRHYGSRSGRGGNTDAYGDRRSYSTRSHPTGPPGYGYGQGYGQGYDAALGARSGSVSISAAEYQELVRKAKAYDDAQNDSGSEKQKGAQ